MMEYDVIYENALFDIKMVRPPISGNKLDIYRIYVLPVGWNWQEMYVWLLPNEIQPYLGQTFT